VELAPALLPPRLYGLDAGLRRRLLVRIGGQLQLAVMLALLEAFGKALQPLSSCLLRAVERDADRNAVQRNALFSLSKKLSCCA
jgi:hypothetical protein